MNSLAFGSLIVNGCRDELKRAALFEYLNQKKLKVAFLQETHSDIRNQADRFTNWKGEIVLSHGSNLSVGVAILFSEFLKPVWINTTEIKKIVLSTA